jgi:hypothetical protein
MPCRFSDSAVVLYFHCLVVQARAIQVGRDCAETGVEISLWHMNRLHRASTSASARGSVGEQHFDPERFYMKMLQSAEQLKRAAAGSVASTDIEDEDDDEAESLRERVQGCGLNGFDVRQYRVRRKEYRKRRLGSIQLYLCGDERSGSGFAISMAMYKLILPAKRPSYVWLHSLTNMPTKSVTIMLDNSTAAPLDELQITTYIEYNGTRATISY